MKTLIFIGLIWLFAISPGLGLGQEKAKSSTDKKVLLNVTVVNREEYPIAGLKAEDFRLFENRKPLEISYFSNEVSPLSVAMILDSSPSMREKVDVARKGMLAFLEKCSPADEFFLAVFDEKVEVLSEFADAGKIKDIVSMSPYFSRRSRDKSSLYDAIVLGVESLSKAKNRKRVLLIFADGNDNNSSKNYKDVEKMFKEKDIAVYFINFADMYEFASHSPLEKLSDVFEGSLIYVGDVERNGIPSQVTYRSRLYSRYDFYILSLSELPEILQKQYTIGFKPNIERNDNKWRKIEIKLELQKDFRKKIGETYIWHRKGYYPFSELVIEN